MPSQLEQQIEESHHLIDQGFTQHNTDINGMWDHLSAQKADFDNAKNLDDNLFTKLANAAKNTESQRETMAQQHLNNAGHGAAYDTIVDLKITTPLLDVIHDFKNRDIEDARSAQFEQLTAAQKEQYSTMDAFLASQQPQKKQDENTPEDAQESQPAAAQKPTEIDYYSAENSYALEEFFSHRDSTPTDLAAFAHGQKLYDTASQQGLAITPITNDQGDIFYQNHDADQFAAKIYDELVANLPHTEAAKKDLAALNEAFSAMGKQQLSVTLTESLQGTRQGLQTLANTLDIPDTIRNRPAEPKKDNTIFSQIISVAFLAEVAVGTGIALGASSLALAVGPILTIAAGASIAAAGYQGISNLAKGAEFDHINVRDLQEKVSQATKSTFARLGLNPVDRTQTPAPIITPQEAPKETERAVQEEAQRSAEFDKSEATKPTPTTPLKDIIRADMDDYFLSEIGQEPQKNLRTLVENALTNHGNTEDARQEVMVLIPNKYEAYKAQDVLQQVDQMMTKIAENLETKTPEQEIEEQIDAALKAPLSPTTQIRNEIEDDMAQETALAQAQQNKIIDELTEATKHPRKNENTTTETAIITSAESTKQPTADLILDGIPSELTPLKRGEVPDYDEDYDLEELEAGEDDDYGLPEESPTEIVPENSAQQASQEQALQNLLSTELAAYRTNGSAPIYKTVENFIKSGTDKQAISTTMANAIIGKQEFNELTKSTVSAHIDTVITSVEHATKSQKTAKPTATKPQISAEEKQGRVELKDALKEELAEFQQGNASPSNIYQQALSVDKDSQETRNEIINSLKAEYPEVNENIIKSHVGNMMKITNPAANIAVPDQQNNNDASLREPTSKTEIPINNNEKPAPNREDDTTAIPKDDADILAKLQQIRDDKQSLPEGWNSLQDHPEKAVRKLVVNIAKNGAQHAGESPKASAEITTTASVDAVATTSQAVAQEQNLTRGS